jgi:hypothetical protein
MLHQVVEEEGKAAGKVGKVEAAEEVTRRMSSTRTTRIRTPKVSTERSFPL